MVRSSAKQALLKRRTNRPTILDRRFRGDPWVEDRRDGTLALYLGNYRLANLPGLPLDQPHLNQLLERLRQEKSGPVRRG
jgi:hypothetical protein